MKTIGLIGGMSWESTVTYYQVINTYIREKLGGLHSAKLLLYSVDFAQLEAYQSAGEWEKAAELLTDGAKRLEAAGADYLLLCANTVHKLVGQMQPQLHIPILHIAKTTAEALHRDGIEKAGLLGTKYTLTEDFYKAELQANGVDVLLPEPEAVEEINRIIYQELCVGIISETSRAYMGTVIEKMAEQGAQGVILGCTEIGLLVRPEDSCLPTFDTALIHAQSAAALALEK